MDEYIIAWEEEYEKNRKVRFEKFWNEFFEKHFDKNYRDPTLKFSRDNLEV